MTVGIKQQVVARPHHVMSRRGARKVTMILCAGIFVVIVFSQFMRWQITTTINELEQLQNIRNSTGSENISLLDERAKLISKEYIAEKVGSKLQLFMPDKDQIRRL